MVRKLVEALRNGEWRGHRAFVVGSGPSMSGFDYSLLDREKWIACNEEYKHGKPSIALVQDVRLFAQGGPGLVPLRDRVDWTRGAHLPVYFKGHPDLPLQEADDPVYLANTAHSQHTPFRWGRTLEEGLYYGANVGMAALNLAEILGADPIYLLGFDARTDDERTHHHRDYPPGWSLDDRESRAVVYRKWHEQFREIAKVVRSRVVNLNIASGIDAFPKKRWWAARTERGLERLEEGT